MLMKTVYLTLLIPLLFVRTINLHAQQIDNDYFDISLEDLINVEVVTASKKSQKVEDAPVPVYVITHEDLKIYGTNHIGEALKMVPGVEVIQGADHDYQISIRGLSTTGYNVSNKVLFLINGRSVYNEIFGGVRMQSFIFSVDEIERIEVVRGAGSALYGANAFSGIVNIITRKPVQEKGIHAGLAYGSFNQMQGNVRYGQSLSGGKFAWKIGLSYQNLDQAKTRMSDLDAATKTEREDLGYQVGNNQAFNAKNINLGFAYKIKEGKEVEISTGFSDNVADTYYTYPAEFKEKDYFAQVQYIDSNNIIRAFYNNLSDVGYGTSRFLRKKSTPSNPYLILTQRPEFELMDGSNKPVGYQTIDIEYQRNLKLFSNFNLTAGASLRNNIVEAILFSQYANRVFKNQYFGAIFAQAEYKPIDKLTLIAGGRFDYNNVIGKNINPRFTALYHINSNQSVRLGAGTSTRNPHFFDLYLDTYVKVKNLQTATGLNPILNLTCNSNYVVLSAKGNENLRSEQMINVDAGYQAKLSKNVQIKVDAFYNQLKYAIKFSISQATQVVERIENIHGIFAAQGADVSTLIANDMNKAEMENTIQTLNEQISYLSTNDPSNPNLPKLIAVRDALAGTPAKPGLIALYGTPKEVLTSVYNDNTPYNFFGGEISLYFILNKKFSVTANYAYLYTDNTYDNRGVPDGANLPNFISFPEHKVNIGVKYQFSYLYTGIMGNYMSKITYLIDNNKNGIYDIQDVQNYSNKGSGEVKDRLNLNINLGFRYKNYDFYITGMNLIQPDYQQLNETYSVTGGDMLNRRFLAGIRVDF